MPCSVTTKVWNHYHVTAQASTPCCGHQQNAPPHTSFQSQTGQLQLLRSYQQQILLEYWSDFPPLDDIKPTGNTKALGGGGPPLVLTTCVSQTCCHFSCCLVTNTISYEHKGPDHCHGNRPGLRTQDVS